jgi:DNA-binding NarL/FixJ family response regulator
MDKIRVAVVDDHPLFRRGVAEIVAQSARLEVVAEGASARDAATIVDCDKPDVLILDIGIPGDGFAALEAIAATHPEIKVLMLSVSDSMTDVQEAFRLGARGYLAKGMRGSELVEAVLAASEGQQYLSSGLGAKLASAPQPSGPAAAPTGTGGLSVREAEILASVKQGLSNKRIAAKLGLSDKTIKHYMTGLLSKLGVHSRLEAALATPEAAAVDNRPPPKAMHLRPQVQALESGRRPPAASRRFLGLEYGRDSRAASRKG